MINMNNSRLQRGGTFLGFILGLVIGLAVALGVAMYVTKVPTPFSNKNQTRSVEQDAAENQKKEVKPAVSADPLGDLAKSKTAEAPAEPFQYFVQVGAYRSQAEADAQKAKMALMGLDAKVSEREQAGRTVYRVRLGPFDDKAAADRIHAKLDGAQLENTIVRMQR